MWRYSGNNRSVTVGPCRRIDDADEKQATVPCGFVRNDPRINRRGRPRGSKSGADELKQAVRGDSPESVAIAEAVLTAAGPVAMRCTGQRGPKRRTPR
jgi:hypothetical protein